MKSNVSPITSSAADASSSAASNDDAKGEREALATFEAMLMATVMKPLCESLGPMGGVISDGFARETIATARTESGL